MSGAHVSRVRRLEYVMQSVLYSEWYTTAGAIFTPEKQHRTSHSRL